MAGRALPRFALMHRLFFRAGAGTISKFARLHNAQFLSTYRSVRLHNSFTCMGNRIDYFSSGSSMEPHRASAHSSILWNVIQIFFFCSHFFEHRGNHTDYFFSGRSSNGTASMGTDLMFAFLSTVERRLTADRSNQISVRVIATIGITHGRKTISPSRNPRDSDPFLVANSQSSTSVAKLFAFRKPI